MFLAILKKYVSKDKIYFGLKRKSNVSLHKKFVFVFGAIFEFDLITYRSFTDVYILFPYFFYLLYQFLRNST